MSSLTKRFRRFQSVSSSSHPSIESSNVTGDSSFISDTEKLEQSIKVNVESHVLLNLLFYAKQLNELIFNDERFSRDYFKQIEKSLSNFQSNQLINDLIKITEDYLEKYLLSSVNLRCYIQLHVPSSQSGNNQGVDIQLQILKELKDMENIIENNENLFIDYYKKHYEILKFLNKYPSIEDYHLYLIEFERKIFDDIRSMILELRTMFLKTYDIIMKNLTKIQMPRNQQNLYMIN